MNIQKANIYIHFKYREETSEKCVDLYNRDSSTSEVIGDAHVVVFQFTVKDEYILGGEVIDFISFFLSCHKSDTFYITKNIVSIPFIK